MGQAQGEQLWVICWRWGHKYAPFYTTRLAAGVARNLKREHRFIVCQPPESDEYLTRRPGCFARLRTFDPEWQASHGIKRGDKILCLDLDLVVTGSIDHLADREEPFTILQGVNAANPNPYNGSVWMLRAGYRPDVFSGFSFARAEKVPFYAFPDDQAWFHHHMPSAGAYGPKSGVYGYQKPGWPGGTDLPGNACIVAFFGNRDPKDYDMSWLREHWR